MDPMKNKNTSKDNSQQNNGRPSEALFRSLNNSIRLFFPRKYYIALLISFLISLPFTRYAGPFYISTGHRLSTWLVFGFLATIIAHVYNKNYPRRLATIGAMIYSTSLITYIQQDYEPTWFYILLTIAAGIFMLGFFLKLKNIPAAMVMAAPVIAINPGCIPREYGFRAVLFEFGLLLVCSFVISIRHKNKTQTFPTGEENE